MVSDSDLSIGTAYSDYYSHFRRFPSRIALLNDYGTALVEMPEGLGLSDFRYQLTSFGGPTPDLHIAAEMTKRRFAIAGGAPSTKVSWQLAAGQPK
jgi:hypothetical protein